MKKVAVFTICLFALLAQSSFAHSKTILITAFHNRPEEPLNGSIPIAQKVQTILMNRGHQVNLCFVQVVYDQAAQDILKCIEALSVKPEIVISLGEVGPMIDVETTAYNRNNSAYQDLTGDIRKNEIIDRKYPRKIQFNYPIKKMIQTLEPEERLRVKISNDPYAYVCNNTAFWLANLLPSTMIYGFIHVPTSLDHSDLDQDAVVIAKMIDAI